MKMRSFLNFLFFEACIFVFVVINYKEIATSVSISNASKEDYENEAMLAENRGKISGFQER